MRARVRARYSPPMPVPVVALYAPLNAVLNIALATYVVRHRTKPGEDGEKGLQLAIRIHGNNAEFVPFALLMMLIAELCGGSARWLHVAGGVLFVARLAHAFGMPRKAPNPYRSFGVVGTWGVIVAMSFYCIVLRSRS